MDSTASPDLKSAFTLERHGFDVIPAAERTMTLGAVRTFWLGTNANLFFVSVGVLGFSLGLTVWQAILASVAANLLFALPALGSVGAVRTGLPNMTITRAAFGQRGNAFHCLLAWLTSVAFEAINTVLGVFAVVALFDEFGWHDSGAAGKVVALILVLAVSVLAAYYGHAAMVYLQRIFAVVLTAALLLVFVWIIRDVDWNAHSVTGTAPTMVVALFLTVAAVASGPLSYLFNPGDYVRYLPASTTTQRVFWAVFNPATAMAIFLCIMGVLLASRTDMSDPVAGVKPLVPNWLFLIYAVAVVCGIIANNVPTFYSSGLVLQAIGVPLRRYQATLADVVVSTALICYVLFVRDFTSSLFNFVAFMIVWIGPFGAVWITDGLLRRWQYDVTDLHANEQKRRGRYWGWHGLSLRGNVAWLLGAVGGVLTVSAPIFTGPVAAALGGVDLNWILGPVIAALSYAALSWTTLRPRLKTPPLEMNPLGAAGNAEVSARR